MIQVTRKFHFETAHAIASYEGPCKNIHGHSYELHVTVGAETTQPAYIESTGFFMDFKLLKKIVEKEITERLDHKLILSKTFISKYPLPTNLENLVVWDHEPSAENLLIYISENLKNKFPGDVKLLRLKLYETKDAFAEWTAR